ncbi:hypothetical protein DH2020_001785 [Rehmannia glutinosa]|uniref:DDE Tnp4 domain-containing protein n=1 Tax=Rehmannia glutinosa TaxID=99300 RepID=A0ABR0XRX5_REHGL
MLESFFLVNLLIRRNCNRSRNQLVRRTRGIRYVMANRIPKQVEHLNDLIAISDVDCSENLRMTRGAFVRLCFLLRHVGGLTDSRYESVSNKVVLFLSVIAHHKKIRVVKFDFMRSGQTVSKHIHDVLNVVLKLHNILLVSPEPVDASCTNGWKWFKGCLGALDDTYIKVKVAETDKSRYRTRKCDITVNVLGVCDRNMKFIYVLSGWEGSTADCRVLRDAVNRRAMVNVLAGNFYLCDNGYTNGVRYHLNEWGEGSSVPQNSQEFFNMNYSKARNVIERTFGLLKKRWAILRSQTFCDIKIQNRVIMACALLHNFIRSELSIDPLEELLDEESDEEHEDDLDLDYIDVVEASQAWFDWRDNLACSMFNGWRGLN